MTDPTPGPWIYQSGMVWRPDSDMMNVAKAFANIPEDNGISIARMDRNTSRTEPTERDANARLIAAAPDLLDACKWYLHQYDSAYHGVDKGETPMRIRAAIAKAEGS